MYSVFHIANENTIYIGFVHIFSRAAASESSCATAKQGLHERALLAASYIVYRNQRCLKATCIGCLKSVVRTMSMCLPPAYTPRSKSWMARNL